MPKTLVRVAETRLDGHMTNFTATADRDLDRFFADMTNQNMPDALDMALADRDWTPVPVEYWNMCYAEVCEDIADYAMETFLAEQARNQIPHRWQ